MYLELTLVLIPATEAMTITYLLLRLRRCRKDARKCWQELETCEENLYEGDVDD